MESCMVSVKQWPAVQKRAAGQHMATGVLSHAQSEAPGPTLPSMTATLVPRSIPMTSSALAAEDKLHGGKLGNPEREATRSR